MTETDIYTFLELLENHEVYNFRIIRREIESFEEIQEPYEVIAPEGFDEIHEPYEVIPLFDNRVYTYYAVYTDYSEPDCSARQRIFKILNLEELISVVTNDIDSLVVRGHLSLFDTNVDSFLEEIFEK